MYKNPNSSCKLLYNQSWEVDIIKLKQLNPSFVADNNLEDTTSVTKYTTPALQMNSIITPHTVIHGNKITSTTNLKDSPKDSTPQIPQPPTIQIIAKPSQCNTTPINFKEVIVEITQCTKCELSTNNKNRVIHRGNENADWMFIGDIPELADDKTGVPFSGAGGDILNNMISAMNIDIKTNAYICNLVKCSTYMNNNPTQSQIESCYDYLHKQIHHVQPKLIITLGWLAIKTLTNKNEPMNKLRGNIFKYNNIPVIPTFHPTYLLRNISAKKDTWDDLQFAMKIFNENNNQ